MRTFVITLLLLPMVLGFAGAQPMLPPTTCYENIIELPHQQWGGVIPQCMDTLRIGYTPPMEPTGLMSPGTCAALFEVLSQGPVKTYRLIPSTSICENVDRVMVVPGEKLEPEFDLGKNRTYEVHTYCEYWRGKDYTDTTVISFRVTRGFRAHARAIDFETGLEIQEGTLVEPTVDQAVNTGDAPFRLNAWSNEKYEFMYWTCTHATIPYDIYAPFQVITMRCWPVNVTTVFNAFFRARTTTVREQAQSATTVSRSGTSLVIERATPASGEILIMSATGELVRRVLWTSAMERVSLEGLASGVYLCVVHNEHHTTHTLIHLY
ncbi:MAG: hypothetical protein FGM33_02185 [Candidatus Kapabacteria bacterium]|nr:hypothetical protein [Candidatus Kapabacteria bacterium]